MIPEEKSDAVQRALRDAFGVTAFDDIRRLTKGRTSALVFRIIVRGTPFLLRIIMRTDDPTDHFVCMRAAADAGLAPRVWYASVDDRLSITDFVEEVPFPATDALVRMAATLRTLHALRPFPGRASHLNTSITFLLNKGPALDGFIQNVQTANLFSKDAGDELFARYSQAAAVYARHESDMVSSHNDLFKPDNILFDGNRVWLVDWEAAFLNDRYADLAVVANLIVTNDADEKVYLQEYFGQPPDPYQHARFFLMQQVAHMFYAMGFLVIGSAGKPVDQSEKVPEYGDFHRQFWAGDIHLDTNQPKVVYGRVHLERLMQNARHARFEEALRIVSDQQARRTID